MKLWHHFEGWVLRKNQLKKKLEMKIHVIYGLPCVFNIADVIKNNNNTSNKGSNHYFPKKKKQSTLGKDDVIILITWIMSKTLLKSKHVLYQVSSGLGEVKSFLFIAVFLTWAKKPLKSLKKPTRYRVNYQTRAIIFLF